MIASLIIFPLIIPVYIHDFIFNYFIIRKKYILYIVCAAILVYFFGTVITSLLAYIEPSGSLETYSALILVMLLYTGARYLRIGAQQQMLLKNELEKRIKAEMELKELESKQSQAELTLLKSQVNPHFLFNTLNSIYSLILNNSDNAGDAVMKLSDLMRYLLESTPKRKVLLKNEFEFLQNYIELELIRLGNKTKVNYEFKGDVRGKIISPLLLIPFIENCFKHGVGLNFKLNQINISVELDNDTLFLITRNNIVSEKQQPHKRSGTGIENVRKRLDLLYPEKHKLEIIKEKGEFFVDLKVEL